MNIQPVLQSKSSSNGFPLRRGEKEGVSNKAQSITSPNTAFNGEARSLERPSRDRLVYLTTCKIGHHVEVHLKNGSVYSGIFHAADVEKDFGIILKMASLIKEGTLRGHKSRSEFVRKPPSKTFIIPADELVQVVAKDLSVSWDSMNAVQSKRPMELLTDASISQSYHGDQERQLKPWVPDEDLPQGADLEDVFDNPGNRRWDQFEVNESLFGVKSTFNEELYTTKLEKGTHFRKLEEQAWKIAKEIEGENTRDLHVAEERGHQLNDKFDIDEETKYSSVRRAPGIDDSGFDEENDALLDIRNNLTFGDLSSSEEQKPTSSGKGREELWGDNQSSRNNTNVDQSCSISDDHARHLPSEQRSQDFPAPGSSISDSRLDERKTSNNQVVSRNSRSAEESTSGHGDIIEGAKVAGGATSAGVTERERQVSQVSGKTKSESSLGQSASRSSENRPGPSASSRPGLSPSSSIGSMSSSEKSTLNPNAKEFKLNPNAKSFKPSQPAAARPQSPISDASFYFPGPSHVPVQQMPGMPPVNYGVPPYPAHQPPMIYHPQNYYPPHGQPQYPQQQQQQQMMPGQQPPRPLYYVQQPPYQPEMPYHNKGRE